MRAKMILLLTLMMTVVFAAVAHADFSVDELIAQGQEIFYDDFELDWVDEEPMAWTVVISKGDRLAPFVVVEKPELSDGLLLQAKMHLNGETEARLQAVTPIPLTAKKLVVDFEYYFTPVSAYDVSNIVPQFNFELQSGGWPPKVSIIFTNGKIVNIVQPSNASETIVASSELGTWHRGTVILDLEAETVQFALDGELQDYVGLFRSPLSGATQGTANFYWKVGFTDWYLRYVNIVAID